MTVMDAALRESLKALRLSGMLETLDARPAQAHGGELGHLDFLQVLCQDEITRRETVAFQRRLQRAKFEQQVTQEFDFTASSKLPAAQIRDLGALRWLHAGESVILFGPVGVGKTHIAQALGHLAVRQGAHVRFAKTSRILADLAGGHADRTWEIRVRELVRPDVLILDDFAMRRLSAAQADDLYELVSERQGRSLIITSNGASSDWHPLFPNPVVTESLLDRLINTSQSGDHERAELPPEQAAQEPHRQDQVERAGGRRRDTWRWGRSLTALHPDAAFRQSIWMAVPKALRSERAPAGRGPHRGRWGAGGVGTCVGAACRGLPPNPVESQRPEVVGSCSMLC
jgi:DNA replication protein DnaC